MIRATSPNQEGVEGIDSRSGLDTHRDIGDTSHVYLLVGNSVVLPHQGGIFLSWFATGYISLRNSWALHPDGKIPLQQAAWYPKTQATFSDVLATVRRHLWGGLTFQTSASHPDLCLVPRADLARLLQAACY